MLAHLRERGDHLGGPGRRFDVRIEDVLPRTACARPRFELRQVEVTFGESPEAAIERAGDMAYAEDQRRLVGLPQRLRITRQRAKARVVVGVVLDASGENLQPVQLGCA